MNRILIIKKSYDNLSRAVSDQARNDFREASIEKYIVRRLALVIILPTAL